MKQDVYTLLCERDMGMALVTLPRVIGFLGQDQRLIVMDDGSLTEKSASIVKSLSDKVEVIGRKEREDMILSEISGFPHCMKFREEYAPAFKLIDIPILAGKEERTRFCYTDSDIIYLRNCEDYFRRDVNTYLRTDGIKISVKLSKVFFKYKWSIPYKFNSGYFSYDCSGYDLDLIEYFVSRPDVRNVPWVIEQTGWGLVFGASGPFYSPNEDQFVCREQFEGPKPDTLAIHLIANLKGKVDEWANTPQQQEAAATPDFQLSRSVSFFDWAKKSAKRVLPL
ncbi:hypothetical protein [Arcticibacter sp. MXS-1]|uniref:hypothetical protein n=1 Tax=Arcticibacter sp. MXS-1 TaxID=3341726 RepID=UPI0035A88D30